MAMGSLLGPNAANYALQNALPRTSPDDLAAVVHVLSMPNVLVANPRLRTSVADLKRIAAGGRPLSMAVSTSGSSGHLAGELFKARAGIEATNIIYRGAAPALVDLIGGQVDFMVDNLITRRCRRCAPANSPRWPSRRARGGARTAARCRRSGGGARRHRRHGVAGHFRLGAHAERHGGNAQSRIAEGAGLARGAAKHRGQGRHGGGRQHRKSFARFVAEEARARWEQVIPRRTSNPTRRRLRT